MDVRGDHGDRHGLTVWHLAILEDNVHAIGILRDSVVDGNVDLNLKTNDGRTLMHCAAQSSSKSTLAFLMDACDQNTVYDTTQDGFTALHYAVKAGPYDAVQYLIDRGFDTHAKTNDGSSTLHCAVDQEVFEVGNEIVKLLLQSGVDPCNCRNDGMTPIHLLLSRMQQGMNNRFSFRVSKFETLFREIIKDATSLDSKNGAGLSALHQVCQVRGDSVIHWRCIVLKILLQNGADPELKDSMGKTALAYLVEAYNSTLTASDIPDDLPSIMIKEFLDSTTNEHFISKICTDPRILCLALRSHNEDLAYKVLEYCSSVDATDYEVSGLSPLETACQYGCSRPLLQDLLGRSQVDRGAAGSKSGLLCLACKRKGPYNEATVTYLLDLGFDPNDRTVESTSALMIAAEAGALSIVEILIHRGADVSVTNNSGWSVIHCALLSGNEELWRSLQHVITDWNGMIAFVFSGIWCRDATALHLAASLDNSALEFLLKNDLISNINHLNNLQETALCIAACYGISRNVDLLLEANADTVSSRTTGEYHPLHLAAWYGHMEVVEVFASRGANMTLQNSRGLTPELVARTRGHFDVAEFLKEMTPGGYRNFYDIGRKNLRILSEPLRLAIGFHDTHLCRGLMDGVNNSDSGFLDCESDTSKWYSPFHHAASVGSVQILQLLFEKAPREILRCCRPVHPIHLAIVGGHVECVELILDQICKVGRLTSPSHVCGGDYDLNHVVEISVSQSGSDWIANPTTQETFSQMGFVDGTPLKMAATLGAIDTARSLIEHGASVDGTDSEYNTPLHFAAREGHTPVVELLIRSGANVDARNFELCTPCMEAARTGHLAPIQALIQEEANIALQDDRGFLALHHAAIQASWGVGLAFSEYLDVIIFLIYNTKDTDVFGETKTGFSIVTASAWAYPPYQSFLLNWAPNPSVYEPRQSNIMIAIVKTNNPINLKRLLRRLPKPLIPTLLAHRDRYGGTPLYAAATTPSEKVINMLLDAGADLELVGGDHGTPLMGACAAGRLEVVKILVRKGAKTSYTLDGEVFSVIAAARLYPKVTRWLLVGRFLEGPLSIENSKVEPEC